MVQGEVRPSVEIIISRLEEAKSGISAMKARARPRKTIPRSVFFALRLTSGSTSVVQRRSASLESFEQYRSGTPSCRALTSIITQATKDSMLTIAIWLFT
jgi:hypothetical protein